MAKLQMFDKKPIFVRVKPGVRDRIDRLRGEARQGEFVRKLLMEAIRHRENLSPPARPDKLPSGE